METLNQLSKFINKAALDSRLKPMHIALYFPLCHTWIVNGFQKYYLISRRQLMTLSRIQSNATYHKTISELVEMGYICYRPSYHPRQGSEVALLGCQFQIKKHES